MKELLTYLMYRKQIGNGTISLDAEQTDFLINCVTSLVALEELVAENEKKLTNGDL